MIKQNNKNYEEKTEKKQSEKHKKMIEDIRKQANIRVASMNADNASNRET